MVVKVNPHFEEYIFDWDFYYYIIVGGYGSSKSYNTALKLLIKLSQEKRTALVVREVYDTHKDSTFALFEDLIETYPVFKKMCSAQQSPLRIKFKNGSKIIFKGMDKPAKLKSVHNVSTVWIEECTEVKYEGFKELIGRLRHPSLSLHIILTSNPVSKSTWLYKHFFIDRTDFKNPKITQDDNELYDKKVITKKNKYYHHSTCDDNFFLPASYIEQLDEMKEYDPDLYRIAREGKFGTSGTKVLPQFEVANSHQEVMDAISSISLRNRIDRVGMDFGFETSYNALVRLTVDHLNKILYIHYCYYDRGKTDDITAEEISEFKESRERIKADSAEPKTIKYYRQQGFNMVPCKKFKGSRAQYTKKVKRFKKIICSPDCGPVVQELQDLTYKLDNLGEIIEDEFNIDPHTLSAIWYALDDYEVSELKGGGVRILTPKDEEGEEE